MNLGKKIVIVGSSGSGKTTFAGMLSKKLNIKHYEIDEMFWKPNWIQTGEEEFRELVSNAVSNDEWIIDGNYKRNQDLTVWKADTIIWLDYSLPRVMYRVTLRTTGRLINRKPLWHNNRESLRMAFSKDSIILYSLNNHRSKRRWYKNLMNNEELKHLKWIIIKNNKDERQFWDGLI